MGRRDGGRTLQKESGQSDPLSDQQLGAGLRPASPAPPRRRKPHAHRLKPRRRGRMEATRFLAGDGTRRPPAPLSGEGPGMRVVADALAWPTEGAPVAKQSDRLPHTPSPDLSSIEGRGGARIELRRELDAPPNPDSHPSHSPVFDPPGGSNLSWRNAPRPDAHRSASARRPGQGRPSEARPPVQRVALRRPPRGGAPTLAVVRTSGPIPDPAHPRGSGDPVRATSRPSRARAEPHRIFS